MPAPSNIDPLLDAMRFRCIGPPRGGRVVAVAGDPSEPAVFWFGAVAGGIWKTEDAGVTWMNVSDGYLKTSSVGALSVSDSDPNVIWAGMGESTIRGDVSHGDGVYRSTDRGRSWVHLGLADTRHVSEIRVHPRDPDRVWVAALGHAFGPNPERGVFRTTDGGASWERTLYVDERSGAADLALDTRNPTVLYASLWQVHRNFWELSSGGPGSGLWRSDDGGATWTAITPNLGLPAAVTLGKIGIAASPARSGRVWALVESDAAPGLYRSDDFGESWTLASDRQELRHRPWYYMHVFADPRDEDTVYVNNLRMWKSTDAGAHFDRVPTPHGDNHDLWIDPNDNRRMIQGNDGGANVSFNAGASWSSVHNQLTAQLYTVDTDGRAPHYVVYGTQQDNSSVGVPSGTNDGAIAWEDCRIAGTGESGYVAVDPKDPDVVYVGAIGSSPGGGGALQRYDHRTGQVRLVNVWPEHHGGMGPGELRYRFGWTFPIRFSPHDPNVLYTGGNRLFRTTDEGQSWEPVSPDLTRAAADKLGPSGGPITRDTSGAEHYCTLSTFAESPHEPGVLWTGSDDGLVHLSRDGGRSWRDVTPPGLPDWAFIRTVEPSPHDPAALYLAATRYKLDDNAPYLYRTTDYGESWQAITGSEDALAIPGDDFVRVIRADPGCRGVLYVGTETGLHVSLDEGATWRRWRSNFPVTPVYDLKVEGTDLVVATHGRSFWILDDLTPLHREVVDTAAGPTESDASAGARHDSESVRLYAPRRAWRLLPGVMDFITSTDGKDYSIGLGRPATSVATRDDSGQVRRAFLDAGEAAPAGVIVYYSLPEGPPEGRADGFGRGRDEHRAGCRGGVRRVRFRCCAGPLRLHRLPRRRRRPPPGIPPQTRRLGRPERGEPGPRPGSVDAGARRRQPVRVGSAPPRRDAPAGQPDRGGGGPGATRAAGHLRGAPPGRRSHARRILRGGQRPSLPGGHRRAPGAARLPHRDTRQDLGGVRGRAAQPRRERGGRAVVRTPRPARRARGGGRGRSGPARGARGGGVRPDPSGRAHRLVRPAPPGPPERGARLRHRHRGQRRRPAHGPGPGAGRGVHGQDRPRAGAPEGPAGPRSQCIQRPGAGGGPSSGRYALKRRAFREGAAN